MTKNELESKAAFVNDNNNIHDFQKKNAPPVRWCTGSHKCFKGCFILIVPPLQTYNGSRALKKGKTHFSGDFSPCIITDFLMRN